ncbi:hypothetical protein HPP92_010265 [Vanilla planifolia]|uniref:Uncharacterized protein n=1 Tax=Vanilla planifolia TaxID=51239 RepID=A0A835QYK8_VANPL|nr:hypothetical protein HPP92_010265 [Vanilla planifolia]
MRRVDEEIRGFDVAVDNPLSVEVDESGEDLAGYLGEQALEEIWRPSREPPSIAKDLDLTTDLTSNSVLVVAIDHLESEDAVGVPMTNHPYGAAAAASDAADALEVGEAWCGQRLSCARRGHRWCSGGGGGRDGDRGVALGHRRVRSDRRRGRVAGAGGPPGLITSGGKNQRMLEQRKPYKEPSKGTATFNEVSQHIAAKRKME